MAGVSFLLRATEFRAMQDGSLEVVIRLTPCSRGVAQPQKSPPSSSLRVLKGDSYEGGNPPDGSERSDEGLSCD